MRGASALAVEQTREVFSHVHGPAKILFYLLAAAATLAFADYAWKRIKKYRRGRAIEDACANPGRRAPASEAVELGPLWREDFDGGFAYPNVRVELDEAAELGLVSR